MPLSTDLRPSTIAGVFGNKSAKATIASVLQRKPSEMPKAFLISGPSGTGKTTFARIIAKEVGCTEMNLVEINAADARGIDTVREAAELSLAVPMDGGSRFFIFDEAHQLTTPAQNALLKAVEDSPRHSFWVFCTTEPGGIIKTIQNRCVSIQTQHLSQTEMKEFLEWASANMPADSFEITPAQIEAIIRSSRGSCRRALIQLEKIAYIESEAIALEAIESEIEDGETPATIEYCRAVATSDWNAASAFLLESQDEPERLRASVCGYLRSCLLKRATPAFAAKIECFAKPLYSASAKAEIAVATYRACMVK